MNEKKIPFEVNSRALTIRDEFLLSFWLVADNAVSIPTAAVILDLPPEEAALLAFFSGTPHFEVVVAVVLGVQNTCGALDKTVKQREDYATNISCA